MTLNPKHRQKQIANLAALFDTTEQVNLYKDVIIEKSKRDLFFFARNVLGYRDITKYTHKPITDALQAPTKRKVIVCPRGSFKSSLCVEAYVVWLLIRDPNERILIDSELYSNSSNFIRTIKAHFESAPMRALFGNSVGPQWNEGEITIAQRNRVFKEASVSAGGVLTTRVGQHYSTICCDDPNSNKNSGTPEARQKVIDHYRYSQSILEPDGKYILVATRYSSNDLVGYILEQELNLNPDGSNAPRYGTIRIQTKDTI